MFCPIPGWSHRLGGVAAVPSAADDPVRGQMIRSPLYRPAERAVTR